VLLRIIHLWVVSLVRRILCLVGILLGIRLACKFDLEVINIDRYVTRILLGTLAPAGNWTCRWVPDQVNWMFMIFYDTYTCILFVKFARYLYMKVLNISFDYVKK
jgi:hypothetical protein